jgi:uncharacterized membrane protein
MDTPTNDTKINNKKDSPSLMGILSYLGPLVIISYLTSKDDLFVKFHIKQGLVLFSIEVIVGVLMPMFFWQMWSLLRLINLATLILSIIGIINVVQKKEKMLPIVGSLSSYFKF